MHRKNKRKQNRNDKLHIVTYCPVVSVQKLGEYSTTVVSDTTGRTSSSEEENTLNEELKYLSERSWGLGWKRFFCSIIVPLFYCSMDHPLILHYGWQENNENDWKLKKVLVSLV